MSSALQMLATVASLALAAFEHNATPSTSQSPSPSSSSGSGSGSASGSGSGSASGSGSGSASGFAPAPASPAHSPTPSSTPSPSPPRPPPQWLPPGNSGPWRVTRSPLHWDPWRPRQTFRSPRYVNQFWEAVRTANDLGVARARLVPIAAREERRRRFWPPLPVGTRRQPGRACKVVKSYGK